MHIKSKNNRKTSDSFGDSDIKNQKRWKKQEIDKILIFQRFLTVQKRKKVINVHMIQEKHVRTSR